MTTDLRTRHYIGLTDMRRLHMRLDADDPAEFKTPPTEPLTLENGSVLYPVSGEVAAEWDSHDDAPDLLRELDDDEDGDDR